MKFPYIIIFLSILFSFFGCLQLYKIENNRYGEPILNDKAKYTFNEFLSEENSKKIDTTAYYIQVFEGRYYNENEKNNPGIIIFHNDGFFKRESVKYFGRWNKVRGKNSVYYGGKYKIIGNKILFESFGRYSEMKRFYKRIYEARIEGNKIIFDDENLISVFEKRKTLK